MNKMLVLLWAITGALLTYLVVKLKLETDGFSSIISIYSIGIPLVIFFIISLVLTFIELNKIYPKSNKNIKNTITAVIIILTILVFLFIYNSNLLV